MRNAVEAWFVYIIKSQLVCETNYVTSSLSTLVCDCVGKEDSEGISFFRILSFFPCSDSFSF